MRLRASTTLVCLTATLLLASDRLAVAEAHGTRGHRPQEDNSATIGNSAYRGPAPEELGGPFTLSDHTGRLVSDETFRGKWVVLYFGFIGCREACPIALSNLALALEQMGSEAEHIQPLFVDFSLEAPDRRGLAQFVSNFHPRLLGLTGTRKQMFSMLRNYRVRREYFHHSYSAKETGPRIDHTTYLYLIGPDGRMRAYFYHTLLPEEMIAAMRRHM